MSIALADPLSFLLITEGTKVFEKIYEGSTEQAALVNQQMFVMGKKPGFALAAQLCKDNTDGDTEDIGSFLSKKLCQVAFGVRPGYKKAGQRSFILTFSAQQNTQFACFGLNIQPQSQRQLDYFNAYASFYAGVLTGAAAHFGQRANVTYSLQGDVAFNIELQEFSGPWEFASM